MNIGKQEHYFYSPCLYICFLQPMHVQPRPSSTTARTVFHRSSLHPSHSLIDSTIARASSCSSLLMLFPTLPPPDPPSPAPRLVLA
jgi:hypothetical protein